VAKEPDRRGELEENRKTIARGMPGDSGVTVATTCTLSAAAHRRPAFPAPSDQEGKEVQSKPRATCAARSRKCVLESQPSSPAKEVVNISPTSSPRNGFAVIAGGARHCARLEGWPRVHASRPSFETLASQAPQDEVRTHHGLESGRTSIPKRPRLHRRGTADAAPHPSVPVCGRRQHRKVSFAAGGYFMTRKSPASTPLVHCRQK
jgi:hypothetical protein